MLLRKIERIKKSYKEEIEEIRYVDRNYSLVITSKPLTYHEKLDIIHLGFPFLVQFHEKRVDIPSKV